MVETYGYALINSGQEQTALFFENIYDEFGKKCGFSVSDGIDLHEKRTVHRGGA